MDGNGNGLGQGNHGPGPGRKGNPKLSDREVLAIHMAIRGPLAPARGTVAALAAEYRVSAQTVRKIGAGSAGGYGLRLDRAKRRVLAAAARHRTVWWTLADPKHPGASAVHYLLADGQTACRADPAGRPGLQRGRRPVTCRVCLGAGWIGEASRLLELAAGLREITGRREPEAQTRSDGAPPVQEGPSEWLRRLTPVSAFYFGPEGARRVLEGEGAKR